MQISQLTAAAAKGLSSALLANVPYNSTFDGCAGFTANAINNMPYYTFDGWTSGCVAVLPASVFTAISATAMLYFPNNIYATGFTGPQFSALPDTVLASISLYRLGYLSSNAINGLAAHHFAALVQRDGADFVRLWSVAQLRRYPSNKDLLLLKAMVPSQIRPLLSDIPTPYTSTTWLEVVFTAAVPIDGSMVSQFDPTTVWGITAAQAPLMTADAINVTVSSVPLVAAIQPDTMANFTCVQVQAFADAHVRSQMSAVTASVFDTRSKACNTTTILLPGLGSKNGGRLGVYEHVFDSRQQPILVN